MKQILSLAVLVLAALAARTQPLPAYRNPLLPVDQRVEDLLGRMTPEEKFWQMYMLPFGENDSAARYQDGVFGFQFSTKGNQDGAAGQRLDYRGGKSALVYARQVNAVQKCFVEQTRLGIPILPFDEALHGVVREGATAFPQSIALAATWDTALMGEVAGAIADEARARGIRQVLSPVLNIAADPRWGRTEETYGEDPFLITQMGIAFVSAFERAGILATPKHFIANVGDGGRDSYPIQVSRRLLEEVCFPPFLECIRKAHATSIMTAYNSYDGTPCTQNSWLLNTVLKNEWGFQGFVISDAGATGGANVLHYTSDSYETSTEQAINSGLDVVFQTSYGHYPLFYKAFHEGKIRQGAIDSAVRRILHAKFALGLFEHPYADTTVPAKKDFAVQHRTLALKAARESVVLLQNRDQVLPLGKDVASVAVIGADATEGRLGGYSREGKARISILEGIRQVIGAAKVRYSEGVGRSSDAFTVVPAACLFNVRDGRKEAGLKGEYFNNITLEGQPALTRTDRQLSFGWTLFSPDPEKINYDYYSVCWTGKLTAPATGKFKIGLRGDDGYRLYLDDSLVIDNWRKQTVQTVTAEYYFREGKDYDLRVEFYETTGNVHLELVWNVGVNETWKEQIREAVKTAEDCEAIVVVAGIEEGEFRDRSDLSLPGHQEEMIRALAATGKPLVVVLVGGSAVTVRNFAGDADAILGAWYPGDEGGRAVAEVLFGDYNPAGRLPLSFPVDVSQLPYRYYHKPTGRGDDYLDLTGKPYYPFGYGLSYTTFEYSRLSFSSSTIGRNDSTLVSFRVRNTGKMAGDEVVQLYIRDLVATVARPLMELKAFRRIRLEPGETKEVVFSVTPEMLSMLDKDFMKVVEPGDFRIMAGASSNDIRLRGILTVK